MPVELVRYLCQHLAAEPQAIEVHSSQRGRVRHIEIRSAPADAGRLIGRGGRVIHSIRLLAQAAHENTEHIEIHYIDSEGTSD